MKKMLYLVTLLAFVGAMSWSTDAGAVRRTLHPVKFELRRAAKKAADWDSLYVNRAAARDDTTKWFSLYDRSWPEQLGAVADSLEIFTVMFGSVGSSPITVGSGTTNLTVQGALDKDNPVTVLGWAAVTLTATGTGNYLRRVSASGATYPQALYPYYRLILSTAATGKQQLLISYPTE